MINYGKLAYNRVNDLYRNNLVVNFDFCSNCVPVTLTEVNTSFDVFIVANGKVFFNLTLSNHADLKILVNGKTEFVKNNFSSASFSLVINKESNLKFVFSNTTFPLECVAQILGNYKMINKTSLFLIPKTNNFMVVTATNNSFTLFNETTPTEVINSFHKNMGITLNYAYLSCCNNAENCYVLCELNGINYIIKNGSSVITLSKQFSSKCKLIACNVLGASFIIVDAQNSTLSLTLFNSNCELLESLEGIRVKGVSDVFKIVEVVNFADNNIYFILPDSNLNNFIVLCNLTENGLTSSVLDCVSVGKTEHIIGVKTTANSFKFYMKQATGLKVVTAQINFVNKLTTFSSVTEYNNATSGCYVTDGEIVLNFDETLFLENGE